MADATSNAESFTASRLTRGNFFFPTRIVVSPEHVLRIKPRLFGSTQESIAIPAVASVQISTGVLWLDIRIDSAGGTNPGPGRALSGGATLSTSAAWSWGNFWKFRGRSKPKEQHGKSRFRLPA